jgi:hypothetical protein
MALEVEQGLIIETGDRPDPELDDERRRSYRITRHGESVARASGFAGGRARCCSIAL